MPKQERDLLKKRFSVARKPTPSGKKKDYTLKKKGKKYTGFATPTKEDIEEARKVAKKKGNKTFKLGGLTYDSVTGDRIPLSLAPSLKALQRRIDYEKTIYGDPDKKRLAKEKKEKERIKRNRERAKANPSLLKGGVNYKKGGMVTKWENKWG